MRKILILTLAALSFGVFAQTAEEEAIILNQELQFLEDSVNNVQAVSVNTLDVNADRDRAINEGGLERKYFGEEIEEDTVSTRTAVPRRRSN